MGQPYYSDFDINHEQLYADLEKAKAENYHLKRQLRNKQNTIRSQKKLISSLQSKLDKADSGKQHYRNGRKRGKRGFNG